MTQQDRSPIDIALLHHARNPASSLLATAIRSVTASDTFVRADAAGQVNADATGAPVVMTLPAGSDAWTGLRLAVVKTDSSSNFVRIARSGTDEIEDAPLSLSTATQHDRLEVYWDGSIWRRSVTGASAGPSASGDTTITGTLDVSGAATFDSIVETRPPVTVNTGVSTTINATTRMITISTTGGVNTITAGDTLAVGQEVYIYMTAASGAGSYTLALADGLTATFDAAGDTLHIKHYGAGVWVSLGGTAVVA